MSTGCDSSKARNNNDRTAIPARAPPNISANTSNEISRFIIFANAPAFRRPRPQGGTVPSLQIGAQFVKDSLARHEVEMAATGVFEKGHVIGRGSSCDGPAREVV